MGKWFSIRVLIIAVLLIPRSVFSQTAPLGIELAVYLTSLAMLYQWVDPQKIMESDGRGKDCQLENILFDYSPENYLINIEACCDNRIKFFFDGYSYLHPIDSRQEVSARRHEEVDQTEITIMLEKKREPYESGHTHSLISCLGDKLPISMESKYCGKVECYKMDSKKKDLVIERLTERFDFFSNSHLRNIFVYVQAGRELRPSTSLNTPGVPSPVVRRRTYEQRTDSVSQPRIAWAAEHEEESDAGAEPSPTTDWLNFRARSAQEAPEQKKRRNSDQGCRCTIL